MYCGVPVTTGGLSGIPRNQGESEVFPDKQDEHILASDAHRRCRTIVTTIVSYQSDFVGQVRNHRCCRTIITTIVRVKSSVRIAVFPR